jgi:hypothetical protein
MLRKAFHIVVAAILLSAALSCGRRAKVIPRSEMLDIYCDILMVDQWAREDAKIRRVADTSLVYARVLRDHGYSVDDYIASVDYYMNDPDRFARILAKASKHLDKESVKYKKLYDRSEKIRINRESAHSAVEKMFARFSEDSLFKGAYKAVADSNYEIVLTAWPSDTSFRGPEIIVKLDSAELARRDSLSAIADSLSAQADSLGVKADSVAVSKDTVRTNDKARDLKRTLKLGDGHKPSFGNAIKK